MVRRYLYVHHFGEPSGADDTRIKDVIKRHRGKCTGSGVFLPTGQRDLEFEVPRSQEKIILEKILGMGYDSVKIVDERN